ENIWQEQDSDYPVLKWQIIEPEEEDKIVCPNEWESMLTEIGVSFFIKSTGYFKDTIRAIGVSVY
ncbi:MAG: hypothetical protein PHN37_02225, partial [Candidatus Pacebacteria bacterium]|nr:hypothetical protein [Candidatus Paceibacterota bacterium]